ncbi:hypothetical protein GC163_07015 [bacterium]|nr:hypothetical protein [bacterium]
MGLSTSTRRFRLRYHPQAYVFVTEALHEAQELMGLQVKSDVEDDSSHISGQELLDGVRVLGLKRYGMMAPSVFKSWGILATEDVGHIVFEMIDRGELRKTDRDQLSDFFDVFSFETVFRDEYRIDTSKAFQD